MTVEKFVENLNIYIVNPILLLLFSVALVLFAWGLFKYIVNADNQEERSKGAQHIVYGLIGFFIMFSVFGIMRLLLNTFDIDTTPIEQRIDN